MQPMSKKVWYRSVYLKSLRWRQTRLDHLQRVGYLCERCKVRWAKQVHHVNYDNLYSEEPQDLLALCIECHESLHHPQAANDNQFILDLRKTAAGAAHLVSREPVIGVVMKKLPDEIKHDLFFDEETGEWYSVPKENDNDNGDGGMQQTG